MLPYKMEVKLASLLFLLSFARSAVIIPEELPSLLSVAYSNIPPIKKGNDHRIGFGFAFGNHADFQVLLELGPQTNTMNLTGQPFPSGGSAKRQAPAPPPAKINKNREKFLSSEGGKYLQQWAAKMKQGKPHKAAPAPAPARPGDVPNLEESMVELVQNAKGEYEIQQPAPGRLPPALSGDLARLYAHARDHSARAPPTLRPAGAGGARSPEEVKKITEDLSNVELD